MHNDEQNTFRDTLGIVNKEGKRTWLYPKKPKGRYYTARTILSSFFLLILFGTPFIKLNNYPIVLFNIIERKFILFGIPFGPHDFYILALMMITFIVFIILFTLVYGRVFCGWICPQTVFMEMIFRKIDYWIEGDAKEQKRLNESPWNKEKIFKKFSKYGIYFSLSFLIANTFLAYIIGIDELWNIITVPPSQHLTGFISILVFTSVFYGVFIWFREQACILVCPYGRLQGVLLDKNSIVIAYDYPRGEPRKKIQRNETRTAGDCIDCKQCVEVCPTGIDIRNGTQLECVNCTACIDACDYVMEKIQKPKGLIRYASSEQIKNKIPMRFTSRMSGYSFVLLFLLTIVSYSLITRTEIDVTILRTPKLFFQEQVDGRISNVYDVKILNKTFHPQKLSFQLQDREGEIALGEKVITILPQEIVEKKFIIFLKKEYIQTMNTVVMIEIYDEKNTLVHTIQTSFLGPVNKKM